MPWALEAQELLGQDFGVDADVWSVTSFSELQREGADAERWNLLHPDAPRRASYVESCLAPRAEGPVVAASDWVRAHAEQIRPFVPRRYRVLGTDGFGRSDRRARLRSHFEVDRHWIAVAALQALVDDGRIAPGELRRALEKYAIDPDKPNPRTV